jgi:branched-subunit amino acid transport protein
MNSPWGLILTMVAGGLVTLLIRLSFIVGGRRLALGPRFQSLLRYVPPAVLSALIAPELLLRGGSFDPSPRNPRLVAGLVAIAVAVATRSVLLTIACGMLALWGISWLL